MDPTSNLAQSSQFSSTDTKNILAADASSNRDLPSDNIQPTAISPFASKVILSQNREQTSRTGSLRSRGSLFPFQDSRTKTTNLQGLSALKFLSSKTTEFTNPAMTMSCQGIVKMDCVLHTHADEGGITPKYKFTINRGLNQFNFDIRELTEYMMSTNKGGDWNVPCNMFSSTELASIKKKYDSLEGSEKNGKALDLYPFIKANLARSRADDPSMQRALASQFQIFKQNFNLMGKTTDEKSILVSELLGKINSIEDKNLKETIENLTLLDGRCIKDIQLIFENASHGDICVTEVVNPLNQFIQTQCEKYKVQEDRLTNIVEEEEIIEKEIVEEEKEIEN